MVNLQSDYKPFIIFEPGAGIKPFRGAVRPEYSIFPWWNHWPVAQLPNDGRRAFAPDRPSHSSLSQSIEGSEVIRQTEKGDYWAVTLTGMTNSSVQDLVPLAKSWNDPADISLLTENLEFIGYSKKEIAYHFYYNTKKTDVKEIRFTLKGDSDTPVYNPVVVIENLDRKDLDVYINQEPADSKNEYNIGLEKNGNSSKVIIWFKMNSIRLNEFTIKLL